MSPRDVGTAARASVGRSLASSFIIAISLGPLAAPAVARDSSRCNKWRSWRIATVLAKIGSAFAVALSVNGRTALVGARGDQSQGIHSAGAAYVFRRIHGEWVLEAQLRPPQPIVEGFFGVSVALSANGNLALVGASSFFAFCGEPICGGAAYFHERGPHGEWHLIQTVLSPDGGLSDAFGSGVALSASGRVAAIGATRAGCQLGDPCGAVFVFKRREGEWQLQDRLVPEIPDPFVGNFGTDISLSLSGRTILIGAENAAFVFRREEQQWTEQAKLQKSGVAFGRSVALSGAGRTALVGSAGRAFVYTRDQSGWSAGEQLPTGPLGSEDVSVAISTTGKRALLGVQAGDGCPGLGNCTALLLDRRENAWTLRQTLKSSDSGGDNSFGDAVSLSATGRVALIGGAFQACFSNPSVCNGAAYLFEAVPIGQQ